VETLSVNTILTWKDKGSGRSTGVCVERWGFETIEASFVTCSTIDEKVC